MFDYCTQAEVVPSQELAVCSMKDTWYMLYNIGKNGLVKPQGRIHVELEFTPRGGQPEDGRPKSPTAGSSNPLSPHSGHDIVVLRTPLCPPHP